MNHFVPMTDNYLTGHSYLGMPYTRTHDVFYNPDFPQDGYYNVEHLFVDGGCDTRFPTNYFQFVAGVMGQAYIVFDQGQKKSIAEFTIKSSSNAGWGNREIK